MLSLISGLALTGAGGAALRTMLPKNGVIHPLARKPGLDSLIPIAIITALAIGIALVISALF